MPQLTPDPRPIEKVTEDEIQEIFNTNRFYEKLLAGELVANKKRNSHTAPDNEPYCTHSQIVNYYDADGNRIAVVHQYERPDGTLGASGRPDPKRIWLEDRIISLKTSRHEKE